MRRRVRAWQRFADDQLKVPELNVVALHNVQICHAQALHALLHTRNEGCVAVCGVLT